MTIKREKLYQTWYAQPVEEVLEELETGINGLSEDEARSRLEEFGPNVISEVEKPPLIIILLHQFKSPLIYILSIAGIITILLRDFIDAAVILGAVALNAVIGFTQEYKAEKSIRALKKLLALKAIMVRGGLEREINAEMIVPGDIILLRSGQKIPADLRLIQVKEFQVDESAFTGESVPALKTDEPIPQPDLQTFEQKNMAFMGSVVTSGRATALVVATGPATQLVWEVHGDPTEVALIVSALRGGLDDEKEKLEFPLLDILPFESEFRYMATLNARDGKVYLLVKGARRNYYRFQKASPAHKKTCLFSRRP